MASPMTKPFEAPKTTTPKKSPATAAKPFAARNAIGVTRRPRPAESSLS